jgi:hypothetical protein
MRGRASVPPRRPPAREETEHDLVVDPVSPSALFSRAPRAEAGSLRKGWEIAGAGAAFAFVCWGIWAAANRGPLVGPLLSYVVVLAVAVGVFAISRLVGRLVLVQRLGRVRRTAKASYALAGLFLVAAGVQFLRQTEWVIDLVSWVRGL